MYTVWFIPMNLFFSQLYVVWSQGICSCRRLLLTTVPVLILSLVILIVSQAVELGTVINAALSITCVIIYFCCFVMAYGPIPNILCAEIFPTRVRGLCIAICALVFWIGDIIVTYTLPVMLTSIGLAGVFGIYAVVCCISFVFVFLKVPETKGMPLEVITEFFAVGARQANTAINEWLKFSLPYCKLLEFASSCCWQEVFNVVYSKLSQHSSM